MYNMFALLVMLCKFLEFINWLLEWSKMPFPAILEEANLQRYAYKNNIDTSKYAT